MLPTKENKVIPSNYFIIPGLPNVSLDTNPKRIIEIICKYYNTTKEQVFIKSKKEPVIKYRQVIHYMLKSMTSLTYYQIGDITGGFDHATVIHNQAIVAKEIKLYPSKRREIDYIRGLILS